MNTNLIVVNKNSNEQYRVYDIAYDKHGYPHFLIYKDGQWLRMSAKYFRPLKHGEWMAMVRNDYSF